MMKDRRLAVLLVPVFALLLAPSTVFGQSWHPPRMADGQPDVQGIWANNSATPLERPEQFGAKSELTDEELAELVATIAAFRDSEQAGDLLGDRLVQQALGNSEFQDFDAETGNYNAFWLVERSLDNRTSLVIDPPHGRIPDVTPEAARCAADRGVYRRAHPSDGPEDRGYGDRCLHFGLPKIGSGYNSYHQILQTPTHVVILSEMAHDAVSFHWIRVRLSATTCDSGTATRAAAGRVTRWWSRRRTSRRSTRSGARARTCTSSSDSLGLARTRWSTRSRSATR